MKILEGKTAIITGATGTIGKQIAVNFLLLGMNVILTTSNLNRKALLADLSKSFDRNKIHIHSLDLTDDNSINDFVKSVKDKPINYLINNAGVFGKNVYKVNFLGTLKLAMALTPILNKNENSRVVFQTSMSYWYAKIDWQKFQIERLRYKHTKRLLNLGVIALKKNFLLKYPNVNYVLAHPGCVISDILIKRKKFLKAFAKPFFHSAKTASLPATNACFIKVPDNKLLGPKAFGVWGKPKLRNLDKKLFDENNLIQLKEILKV